MQAATALGVGVRNVMNETMMFGAQVYLIISDATLVLWSPW